MWLAVAKVPQCSTRFVFASHVMWQQAIPIGFAWETFRSGLRWILTIITYSSPREPRLRLPEPNKFQKCGPVKYGTRTRHCKKNLKNCTHVHFHIFNQTPDIKQCHESDMLMTHMCIKQVCVCGPLDHLKRCKTSTFRCHFMRHFGDL